MTKKLNEAGDRKGAIAGEISTFIMQRGAGRVTPADLRHHFRLTLTAAQSILDRTLQAFGPGGKGYEWAIKQIATVTKKSNAFESAVSPQLSVTRGLVESRRARKAGSLDEAATVMRETADGGKVPGGKPGQSYFRFATTSRLGQKIVTAWYVESAHPKKVQGRMQESFKKAVQTWERSGRFPSGSDIEIIESLDEGLSVPQKHQQKIALSTLKMSAAGIVEGVLAVGAARAAGRPIRPGAEAVQIDESLSRAAGLPNELRKYAHQLPKGLGKPQRYQTKFDGIKEGYYLTIKDMSPGLTGDYRSRGGDLTAVFSIQNIIKQLEGAAKKGRHIVLVRGEGRAPALAESATKSVGAIVGAVLKGDSAPAQVDEANLSKDIMAALKAAKTPIGLRDLTVAIADANAAIKGLDARIVDKGLAKLVLAGKVTRGKGQGTRGVYSMAEEIDEAATVMRQTADGSKVDGGKPGVPYFRFMAHARSAQWSKLTKVTSAWYVESAHPKKTQGEMQDSFKKAVQTWERSGRFLSGSDITVESLDEAAPKPVTMSMADQVAMNTGPKGGDITPAIHAWAKKKFGKGNRVSMSNLNAAQRDGKIEIDKPKGSMGVTNITITRRGKYLIVKNDQGGGMMTQTKTQFFELNESVDEALTPADRKVVKAFVDKKPMEGKRLSTDGRSLDWNGMGGRGVATWGGGKIQLGDTGSSKDSEAHRVIRKEAPKNWIVESVDEDEKANARKMKAKGYKFIIVFPGNKPEPLYAKTLSMATELIKDHGAPKGVKGQPIDSFIDEANDDKTDDLPAKAEAALKAKAKEMGAIKVTGKGPSVNATFDSQEKAQRFLKHAKTVGKAAMRRSGDTEFTVHIDESLDEGDLMVKGKKVPAHVVQDLTAVGHNRRARAEAAIEKIGVTRKEVYDAKKKNEEGEVREAKGTVKITVKKRQGEWAACYYLDGKFQEGPTYYAGGDDREAKQDAESTAKAMRAQAKKKGFTVEEDDDDDLDGDGRGLVYEAVDEGSGVWVIKRKSDGMYWTGNPVQWKKDVDRNRDGSPIGYRDKATASKVVGDDVIRSKIRRAEVEIVQESDGLPEGCVSIGDGRYYFDGALHESLDAVLEKTLIPAGTPLTAKNAKQGLRIVQRAHPDYGVWRMKNPTKGVPGMWDLEREGRRDGMFLSSGEFKFWRLAGPNESGPDGDGEPLFEEQLDEAAPISVEITGIFDNGEWQHPRYTVNVVTNNGDSYNFGMFEPGTAPDSQHTHAEWPSFTNPSKGEVRRGEHMTTIPLAQVPGPLRKQLKALLADATSWQDELEFDEGVVDVAEQARWAPGLYEANRRVLRGSELEQAARSGEVLVIGAGGLQRQTGIKLFPNTAYWMGASTSPDMIVVTAVTDDRVTFASYPYTKTRSDMIRYVMGLIADGTKTHMKQYAAYIDPKQKATWEKNLKGEKGPLNGKQKLQDFQYVLVTCAANGKTRDLYGETKAYGVLVGYYESGSSKAIDGKETSTIKVQRVSVPQMKADPAFDVVKVGRKVQESAEDFADWLVENELEEFTGTGVVPVNAHPWIGAYHSEMQLVLGEPDDLDDDCDGTYLDEHGNVQPLQEGSVTLERKPSGMPGEQFFVVMRDGDPIGFISKLKNTRTETHPWKAFRYKGQFKGDGTDAYDFLGATYAKGATGKRVASNAVVTGRKLTEEVFPESYVERVRETAGYVIEDAYSDCDNAKAAGNTHVVLSGPAQHPTFCASEYEAEALASASSGAIVLTIPEFEEQLAAMESAYLDEGQLNEAIPPTVEGFRMFLVGALTQYDQTQLTRSLKNPRAYHNANALALYLQAIDRVFKDRVMKGVTMKSASPDDLRKFRAAIADYFDPKFPPVKKTLKALDAFLDTGRAPNYPGASKRRSKKEPLSEAYEFVWEHADLFHANADVGTLDEAMNAYKLLMSADKGLINTLDNGRKKLVNAIARAQKEQRNMEQRMGVGQTTAKDQLAIIIKELKAYHDLVGRLLSSSELAEGLDEELITVKVTASNGDYWTTQIQGPFAKAKAYFMGNEFNIGRGGQDLMVKVKKVELVEDALDETQTGSALITFGTKEKRDEAVRAVRNHEGPFACTIANCDETQLRVFWPEAATTSDDEMVEKISSATEHGLFAQLGLKYVSINSVVVEDCDEDGEPLDEASKGATLRDQVQGIFVRNQGTSYTAEDIARLLTISKTEAMKILSSLVTAGTLAFKRGEGYSVRGTGLKMPGSGPHRRGSLASRISDRRTYTHEDEEDDQLDELGNSGRPANWRDGMATVGQAFQARGSAKTKARFANTQLRRVGGGEVPEFASDVSKLSKSMKALKYKGTKGESYEVVHKGRVLGTVSSSGGGMFPWAGRNKQGQKIDQTGYGNLHLAVTRMLASSLGDAWGSAEEDFDETTTSGGVGGFGRATIGGYPENKGREGGIRDDGKHKRGPKSQWSPGALAKIAEQMREAMPEHADEPDEFFAELIEGDGGMGADIWGRTATIRVNEDTDERVVKAVEVYPKRKGGPWLVADPFGNETEHPTKEAAVAAGRAVAETENWGFVVSDGKLAQESVDEAGSKLKVKCGECGKVFATKPSGYPRCPKCKSFDIDIAEAAVDNKRPVRLGPIEKELLKMLRRERGKHGIEELIAASALLQTLPYEDVNIAAQNLATLGLVGGNGRGILLPFGEDDEDLDEAEVRYPYRQAERLPAVRRDARSEVRYPYRIETSGGSGGKLAGVRFYADDAQAKADVTKLAAREQVGRVTTVKRMTAAEAKAEKVPYPNESIDEVTLSNYEVQQRRRGTPVESHWQGGNLTIAKTKALELSRTDSTGIAYVKKHGAGASKVVAAYYKGKPHNESADEDVLDEASIKTGNPEVPEIGFARGTYYYVGKSGAKNSVAIPPAKRKDKTFAETKFRQMLSNEAGGGMGQAAASKLIDKLNAQLGESDESFQTDETELIEFPESMLETYVLAAQAAGLDDDPRFIYEDGAFTAEVPATVAPRIRELVGAAR